MNEWKFLISGGMIGLIVSSVLVTIVLYSDLVHFTFLGYIIIDCIVQRSHHIAWARGIPRTF